MEEVSKELHGKENHASPPPPPPPDVSAPKRLPVARPGVGVEGRPVRLCSNHFTARVRASDKIFYQYTVSIKSDDDRDVGGKRIRRKIVDKIYETYNSDLARKEFAYDGEKSLFTVGPLPKKYFEFVNVLEESSARGTGGGSPCGGDKKRSRRLHRAKTFKVEIKYAAEFPISCMADALRGVDTDTTQRSLRVLDIILRHQQAKRECLLVRQSFFSDNGGNLVPLGGGVSGCRGFHSSFQNTRGGLTLNMDVSTVMVMTPGPVIDFLLANQNVRDPSQIVWNKAKQMLKSMRIKTRHTKREFKIIGLSDLPCSQQLFPMKVRNEEGEGQTKEITVYDYYTVEKKIELTWSARFPCLDVGKPKRPCYLPVELCDLVSLQRYTKALSSQQRASLVEKSRQKPQERIRVVTDALRINRYDEEPMLAACGISIEKQLPQLDGRILNAPTLKVGNGEDCVPRNGRWNFNDKTLWDPIHVEVWAIVNFSARCDISHLSRELINCGRKKGMTFKRPFTLIEEDPQWRRSGPVERVEQMYQQVEAKHRPEVQFLLCVLPERKTCDIYGPWKKKTLHEVGIVTQCISPTRVSDQYLTNVLLKINSKLGGTNSLLAVEYTRSLPIVNEIPTLIIGMDVSHGSPGRADIPSIAAVVGSRCWPLISRYKACVRFQSPKVEMIDSLYKPLPNGGDDGVIRELLLDFFHTSNQQKPAQIVIFRDGVSESQFNQVLNIELEQIIKAAELLGFDHLPRFTMIVAQKNHHTKLFKANSSENVPAGTVVDSKVVHPKNYDFFMCAHAGMIGTSRPTHYNVLLDEIGFTPDELQNLIHSLCYVYHRSTTAISIVAPVAYAHLAAYQMSQFVKFEDFFDSSSGHGGATSAGTTPFQALPRLHRNVQDSMFFC